MLTFLFFCLPFQPWAACICVPLVLEMSCVSLDLQTWQLGFALKWHCGVSVFFFLSFYFFFLPYLNHLRCNVAQSYFFWHLNALSLEHMEDGKTFGHTFLDVLCIRTPTCLGCQSDGRVGVAEIVPKPFAAIKPTPFFCFLHYYLFVM